MFILKGTYSRLDLIYIEEIYQGQRCKVIT